jgi:transcription-repair coupling factor (superfamily II helicase)
MLNELIPLIARDAEFKRVVDGFRNKLKEQSVVGPTGSARSLLVAALRESLGVPLVVVAHQLYTAQRMADDLREWLGADQVLLYPVNDVLASELALSSPEMLAQRIDALARLAGGFRGVIVVPFAGLRRLLPPKQAYVEAQFTIVRGQQLALAELLQRFVMLGYERVEQVENKGEMSIRGGIVDFFPLHEEFPVRIEFFDDEIESIRTFQIEDQRSRSNLPSVHVIPCRETFATADRFNQAADHAREWLNRQLATTEEREQKRLFAELLGEEIEELRQANVFPAIYKYMSLIYPEKQTLLDYVDKQALLVFDDPIRVLDVARQLDHDEAEWKAEWWKAGKMLPALQWAKPHNELFYGHGRQALYLSQFPIQVPNTHAAYVAQIGFNQVENVQGQTSLLKSEVVRYRKSGYQVIFVAAGSERLERMRRVLYDFEIEVDRLVDGNLQRGFELSGIRLAVITENEMFHQRQRKVRTTEKKHSEALSLKSYKELTVGDYVVHVQHGIGQYTGIGTMEIQGVHRDYIHIQYAGNDRLSIPIDQIQLIQKYVGNDDRAPRVHRLGGGEWAKAKSRARSSVKDIADDLIKLYAERQARQGYAFSHDTPEQHEFESMFQYDETPDQLKSIREIKEDMEMTRPMDRLLCGDVGYGKTEVAVRAAFKAAMDGKQVALLVPTTILAQQHYKTFIERFADFPGEIEVLSRFRTPTQIKQTLEKVRKGTVDIIIGTHRLLSKDVKFKNLGLLIVDEEQRFGVTHKEKLKQLKSNVDVLTLTATPIPRTLHMSLIGVRDLSVIETPPENRLPVQTYVVEHSYSLVKDAIERELARDGQVFYLYNRVQGIEAVADRLQSLLPEARIAVAHGQMPETMLERTILDFLDGEYDVLVSTSIIESGVDIPNANTLIVHDADKFGLSQLYQVRGRVGRSAGRVAYAYFTYQNNKVLTEVAEQRLSAIKQFTELGSGFKIAMRDLSIRGAGNLLGAEQSGFIASIGFDLYTQMLAEEIEARKLELFPDSNRAPALTERPVPQMELVIDAYLPSDYIYDSKQKIEMYKRIAGSESIAELDAIEDEMRDRFGPVPQAVQNLLLVARAKQYGSEYGFDKISCKNDVLIVSLTPSASARVVSAKLLELAQAHGGSLKQMLQAGTKNKEVHFMWKGLAVDQALARVQPFFAKFAEVFITRGEKEHAEKR